MEKRIKKIIEIEELNVNQFSLIIGVNRSTLSHILSGRNKPSLEVAKKILNGFPSINANWLLTGRGRMNYHSSSNKEVSTSKTVKKILVFYSDNSF